MGVDMYSHSIKRTCGGPGETKFPAFAATPGTRHKRRKTKTLAEIALVFGDDCICELAANLPADSDLNTFARGDVRIRKLHPHKQRSAKRNRLTARCSRAASL